MKQLIIIAGAALALSATGCANRYYKITDVQSGQEFYTQAWLPGLYGRYGAIHFTDLRSGDRVVLQASRAHPVSAREANAVSPESPADPQAATTQR